MVRQIIVNLVASCDCSCVSIFQDSAHHIMRKFLSLLIASISILNKARSTLSMSLDLCQHMIFFSPRFSFTDAFLLCVGASHLPIITLVILLQGRVMGIGKTLH